MSIASLASKFGTTPEVIRQANNIPAQSLLKVGSTILVPKISTSSHGDIAENIIDNAVVAAANAIAITVAPQSNGKIPHHHGDGNNHNHSNGASNGGGKKHHKHQNGVAKYVQSPIYEIKIPRPKHGPANGSAGSYSNSYSQSNGGSRASSRPR